MGRGRDRSSNKDKKRRKRRAKRPRLILPQDLPPEPETVPKKRRRDEDR